ncbi:MAG: MgtC/SapB family protein [Bacilli bacterium]
MSINIIFIIRLVICILLSLIISYERDNYDSFGLKLYMLVCIGTYLFVTVSFKGLEKSDRVIAQIISGISFLGTGAIIINNNKIRGLDVAATMWCITAIGMLTGLGLIMEALIGSLCVLTINLFINNKKTKFIYDRNLSNNYHLKIKYAKDINLNSELNLIKESITYQKNKTKRNYNICYLVLNNIDYQLLTSFTEKIDANSKTKLISLDIN